MSQSQNGQQHDLDALYQELETLEQRQQELQQQVAVLEKDNARRRELLERGGLGFNRWQLALILISLMFAISVGVIIQRALNTPEVTAPAKQVYHPLSPHLLITSSPPGARVFVQDAEVGVTPKLVSTPAGRYQVRVLRAGYQPQQRSLTVSRQAGKHWHAVLTRSEGDKPAEAVDPGEPAERSGFRTKQKSHRAAEQ